MVNIDSKYDSFIHFMIRFNSKDYIQYQSCQEYSIQNIIENLNFNLYSIQHNIHSIRKPRYRPPQVLCKLPSSAVRVKLLPGMMSAHNFTILQF